MKPVNKFISIGCMTMASAQLLKHSIGTDSLFSGFLMGTGIAFMLLGFLRSTGILGKIQTLKQKLIRASAGRG